MADIRPTKLQADGNGYGSLREFADGDTVPVALGGTGAATAAGARTSLGLGSAAVRPALGSTGALYSRDSILGAVSQASGIPSGAIIERGSNANGEYVRFADGTQICWTNTLTFTAGVSSVGANWSYPASFSSSYPIAGAVSASGAGGDYDSGVSARNQGATYFNPSA
ncbi:phage tail protein, partial [Pseudomonas aeruginosa]